MVPYINLNVTLFLGLSLAVFNFLKQQSHISYYYEHWQAYDILFHVSVGLFSCISLELWDIVYRTWMLNNYFLYT
jgi:hypothetical protein